MGAPVGRLVGILDGWYVGGLVARIPSGRGEEVVGRLVGCPVGTPVGVLVGCPEGAEVGCTDGWPLGMPEGCPVGKEVLGAEVG